MDQLTAQLKDARVKKVIESLLVGSEAYNGISEEGVKYTEDLGLIVSKPELKVSNPIYQEVIPRALTWTTQTSLNQKSALYIESDGRLNMMKLLKNFQQFFREHSEHWIERFDYKEAGPQLLVQAFLQKVVNGAGPAHRGYIHREYGLGRKRTDLFIQWQLPDGAEQRIVLELKLLYQSLEKTIENGLEQIQGYMDRVGAQEGHLLCFDRSLSRSWEDKIFQETQGVKGIPIEVWAM